MLKKGFLKPQLSITTLGKRQFWTGIIIGVAMSFVLSYFFNYSRESLRLTTTTGPDFYILSNKEFRLYDLFFAAFSASLGFGFTIIYWLNGRNQYIKKRYRQVFTIANSWWITFIAIMLVSRFGSILPIVIYTFPGYDNQLDFVKNFWLLLVLIPIYVFFANWNVIRLLFKSGNWILISSLVYALTTFYLFKTTYADRSILNNNYYAKNKERFEYIDNEFLKARKFGICFSDSTKQLLQKYEAERTLNLLSKLKQDFKPKNIVPLDTLILEKIVIHNLNGLKYFRYVHEKDKDKNWPYVLPEEVYYQILKHKADSRETLALFEILHEQILLLKKTPEIENHWDRYTHQEIQRSFYKRSLMYFTRTIQSRLVQVVGKLRADKRYSRYYSLIPQITFDAYGGRQKYYQLKL